MTGASSSVAQQPADPWDLPVPPTLSRRRAPVVVPDSWDDDDDDDEEPNEPLTERNKRIWNDANVKAPAPMPAVVSNTSSHPVTSLPPGAFQPTMRILKRPNGNQANGSGSPTLPVTPTSPDGLKEREAKYQAARHRIFGPASGEDSTPSTSNHAIPKVEVGRSKPLHSKDAQDEGQGRNPSSRSIIRDPRGPTSGDNDSNPEIFRGFQSRRERPRTRAGNAAELKLSEKESL